MFHIDLNIKPNFIRPSLILHPPVPPEMHGVNPRSLMSSAEWDEIRHEVYAKNNYCCWACGIHKTDAPFRQHLEAHELYDIDYAKGTMRLREIVALCHLCHQFVHYARARALTQMGKMPRSKFSAILEHGQRLMREHSPEPWWDIKKMNRDQAKGRLKLKWGDWKLMFEGKEYRSKFRDKDHWNTYHKDKAKTDD